MEDRRVRVRFAPSPTGPLHIGGVRTALYNYLFAKQHGGDLIFRIEDTDSNRFVPGAEEYIIESFRWLGIKFDEGVSFGGQSGPYRQSERRNIYKKYVDQLLADGKAYLAFDTPQELEAKREEIKNFQYDAHTRGMMRNSLTLSKEEVDTLIAEGQQYVVRFMVTPGEDVHVHDMIRGEVVIKSDILDDKVLFKSADELPTYHLANIVDDHLMEVSHVIRGEEWLPSAPLHVLLYRAFGWEDTMPAFAHLPLLLKPDGKGKLSKRDGDRLGFPVFPLEWHDPKSGEISNGFREQGYFPEAVVNFLALLGWNPGTEQELFSLDQLVEQFDISKCSKAGAKFDFQKGIWFNHEYILKKSDDEIAQLFAPIVGGNGAGKSTTLKAICGINRPYRGKIKLFGKPVEKYKSAELFNHCLSMLPQDPKSLFVKKSVREDLEEMNRDKARVMEIAGLCQIVPLLDSHPYDLSGGEQQRAALAKVLLTEPRLLLLDEPTKGIDSFFKETFAGILAELKQKGITIVMVSHDVEFCARYADMVSMFFDGQILTTDTPRRFFGNNSFYTTAANRMSRHVFSQAVTAEDVIRLYGLNREAER